MEEDRVESEEEGDKSDKIGIWKEEDIMNG